MALLAVAALPASSAGLGRFLIDGGLMQREVDEYEAQQRQREQAQRMRALEIERQRLEIERLQAIRQMQYQRAQELERVQRENEELAKQRTALQQQLEQERLARQREDNERSEAAERQWHRDIAEFMRAHPQYQSDPVLRGALDTAVKELANRPENNDRSGPWFLYMAHQQVEARFRRLQEQKPLPVPSRKVM